MSLAKPTQISIDCGNISVKLVEKGTINTGFLKSGDHKPMVTLQGEQLTIKHLPNCNKNNTSMEVSIPISESIDIQMGAGNLSIVGTSKIATTHEISSAVGAGNIDSQVTGIKASRFTASMTAESDLKSKKSFKAHLGAGNISFFP